MTGDIDVVCLIDRGDRDIKMSDSGEREEEDGAERAGSPTPCLLSVESEPPDYSNEPGPLPTEYGIQ